MRSSLRGAERYDPATVEKVERLLELLGEFARDPYLEPRLVLHGGTALNLFHGPMPRLSVDADLLYVGSPDRDVMLQERPQVEQAIRRTARLLGYRVGQAETEEHAGCTLRLCYRSEAGADDLVKVDLIFLDRVPLMGSVTRWAEAMDPVVSYQCVQPTELIARKVKALVERKRPAIRDVFDLSWWGSMGGIDTPLHRALIVYFFSLSRAFPSRCRRLDSSVLARFQDIEREARDSLLPMLPADINLDVDAMVDRVARLLDDWGTLGERQEEYLRRLDEECLFTPESLFEEWPQVLDRARLDPVMARKVENLQGRSTG